MLLYQKNFWKDKQDRVNINRPDGIRSRFYIFLPFSKYVAGFIAWVRTQAHSWHPFMHICATVSVAPGRSTWHVHCISNTIIPSPSVSGRATLPYHLFCLAQPNAICSAPHWLYFLSFWFQLDEPRACHKPKKVWKQGTKVTKHPAAASREEPATSMFQGVELAKLFCSVVTSSG